MGDISNIWNPNNLKPGDKVKSAPGLYNTTQSGIVKTHYDITKREQDKSSEEMFVHTIFDGMEYFQADLDLWFKDE